MFSDAISVAPVGPRRRPYSGGAQQPRPVLRPHSFFVYQRLTPRIRHHVVRLAPLQLLDRSSVKYIDGLSESPDQVGDLAAENYDLRGRPLLEDRASGVPCSRATLDTLAAQKMPDASVFTGR